VLVKAWWRGVVSLLQADLRQFFRVRLIIASSALMPMVAMIAFGLGMGSAPGTEGVASYFAFICPAILALGTLYSTVFSGGYVVILDRQQSVVRDLMLSPASYSSYVTARLVAVVVKATPQLLLSLACAWPFLSGVRLQHPVVMALGFVISAVLFASLGMMVGAFSDVLTFPGWANFILMPFMFFCGVFFPVRNLGPLVPVVQLLPFTSTVELFRYGVMGQAALGGAAGQLALLVLYAAAGVAAWTWLFKRKVAADQ
jgi:ABC-2 type transport system permease protein